MMSTSVRDGAPTSRQQQWLVGALRFGDVAASTVLTLRPRAVVARWAPSRCGQMHSDKRHNVDKLQVSMDRRGGRRGAERRWPSAKTAGDTDSAGRNFPRRDLDGN